MKSLHDSFVANCGATHSPYSYGECECIYYFAFFVFSFLLSLSIYRVFGPKLIHSIVITFCAYLFMYLIHESPNIPIVQTTAHGAILIFKAMVNKLRGREFTDDL